MVFPLLTTANIVIIYYALPGKRYKRNGVENTGYPAFNE
jgi:hypothetical protein